MNIIIINDHGSIVGGASQVAISSLNEIAKRGHKVTFISSVPPLESTINLNIIKSINFNLFDLNSNGNKIFKIFSGIWSFKIKRKIRLILKSYDTNDTIIHIHCWNKSLTSSTLSEIDNRGFKFVITLHDYFAVCPNGALYNYNTHKHCQLKPMSLSCLFSNCDSRNYAIKLWRYIRHFIQYTFTVIPKKKNNYVSVSDYSEKIMRKFLFPSSIIWRINNPINIPKLPYSSKMQSRAFCFIGRLSTEKGGLLFAKAAANLKVPTIFIGNGAESDLIASIYPQANMLGWQSREKIIELIPNCLALVYPTLVHETQGVAVLEAAALGVASIVSDECAASDLVIHGVTGLLFKRGDISSLEYSIQMLYKEPELAKKLGKNAYDMYWKNANSLEAHVDNLITCYKQILNKNT